MTWVKVHKVGLPQASWTNAKRKERIVLIKILSEAHHQRQVVVLRMDMVKQMDQVDLSECEDTALPINQCI